MLPRVVRASLFFLLFCCVSCGTPPRLAPPPPAPPVVLEPEEEMKLTVRVDATNHHLHKPYFVAEVGRTGKAKVVWKTPAVVVPVAPASPTP
jgi:hypothetical protein